MEDDAVATIVQRWGELRPELDPGAMLVVGRIERIAALLDERLRPPFAAAGLAPRDFDVLAALRRQGAPYALSPGELTAAMLVTSGATTKRIDRLERQGYVSRRASDVDGRGRVVTLTAAGRRLTDRLIAEHLDNETKLLGGLTERQRDDLARLLQRLLTSLEPPDE